VAKQPFTDDSLGGHLGRLRTAAGLTLRQVEEASERQVSNAYLSQLENNKISKPSPNILFALSKVYSTSYEDLMRRAGYVSAAGERPDQKPKAATFAVEELTPDEEIALLEYLAFIRRKRS
jgi:transcriptional regulator with XRE-family HTH domain